MISSTSTRVDQHPRLRRGEGPRGKLLAVADHPVDLGHRGVTLGRDLRGAAGDDDPRPGARAARLADRLARLALGLGGDRAGVDDDRIGEPGGARMLAHDLRFVGIEAAAEGDDLGLARVRGHRSRPAFSSPRKLVAAGPVIHT
jgi:hypothetical protein